VEIEKTIKKPELRVSANREIETKQAKHAFYPSQGSITTADATERIKIMNELTESELEMIKNQAKYVQKKGEKYARTFHDFVTEFRNHPLVLKKMTPKKRQYIELISDCQKKMKKNDSGEIVLDEYYKLKSKHPIYDLHRLYEYY